VETETPFATDLSVFGFFAGLASSFSSLQKHCVIEICLIKSETVFFQLYRQHKIKQFHFY
jgi:hypothetical protein